MSYIVYKHTTPNNKVYIGITGGSIKDRWRNNGNGYKKNKHFYSAILKYGWENIKHEILFDNLTKEEACNKEIELIAFYKCNQRDYGYNSAIGGEINRGIKRSEEMKKRISDTLKKRYLTEKPYNYGKHLKEETKQKLRAANLGKKMSEETKIKLSIANRGRILSKEVRDRIKKTNQEKVENILQVDFRGNVINIFNSIQEASRETNVEANKICAVCKGKRKQAKGYIWIYEKDKHTIEERIKDKKLIKPTLLLQLDTYGNVVKEYSNLRACVEETKYSKSAICNAIRKQSISFGFKWKYKY